MDQRSLEKVLIKAKVIILKHTNVAIDVPYFSKIKNGG